MTIKSEDRAISTHHPSLLTASPDFPGDSYNTSVTCACGWDPQALFPTAQAASFAWSNHYRETILIESGQTTQQRVSVYSQYRDHEGKLHNMTHHWPLNYSIVELLRPKSVIGETPGDAMKLTIEHRDGTSTSFRLAEEWQW